MKRFAKRAFIWSGVTVLILAGTAAASYLWILPAVVSSSWVNNIVTKETNKFLGAELKITNPKLSTGLNPKIGFTLAELSLSKNNKELLNLKNIDTAFSFQDIFAKRLIVERLLAENVYVNASGLVELFPQPEQKEQKKSDFRIDIFSAVLGVKNCLITYDTSDFGIKFDAKNVLLDRTRADGIYPLHFDFDLEMTKGKEKITVSADDKDRIYMGGGELHIDKFPIEIDRSNVIIDAFASRKTGMEINIASKNFSARDIFNIVTSNIIIPNGKELLAPILDVKGSVDFNLHLAKNTIRGDVNVNESEFKIKDLLGMPVKITQGLVEIGNTTITLKDFKGFYNNKKENSLVISGSVKDYWKTCDTEIVSDIFVNDDFFKNYISKMLGAPISLVGDAGSRLTLTSKNGSCDVVWYFLLNEGEGFKLGDQSMVLKDYKTLFKVDLSVVKNILKINTIDYYITNELKQGLTPVLAIKGNLDMADNMKMLDIHLNIPRPLPSEFLNFLACQKIFKKGTVSGEISIDNSGAFPKMDGVISFDKVFIPAQRLYIKSAKVGAKGDKLGAIAEGRYKRTKYDFNGYIVNDLRLPIVVKSVNLTLDNVDIEKLLAVNSSQTTQKTTEQVLDADKQTTDSDDVPTFTKGLIIVEKCMLHLDKGKYKEVNFGNLHANLTLDKDGVLQVQSNKFDIAEGISTLS